MGAYALVSHGFCSTCGKIFPNKNFWCDECDRKELMEGWTTGIANYDVVIRNTQEKANKHDYVCLRWIQPACLDSLVEIGQGGFGKIYAANWIDGKYVGVDFGDDGKRVVRREPRKVAVKLLFDRKDGEEDFLQEASLSNAHFQDPVINSQFLIIFSCGS